MCAAEANALGETVETQALVDAMNARQVVGMQPHGCKPEDVIRERGIMARVRPGDHQGGGDDGAGKTSRMTCWMAAKAGVSTGETGDASEEPPGAEAFVQEASDGFHHADHRCLVVDGPPSPQMAFLDVSVERSASSAHPEPAEMPYVISDAASGRGGSTECLRRGPLDGDNSRENYNMHGPLTRSREKARPPTY